MGSGRVITAKHVTFDGRFFPLARKKPETNTLSDDHSCADNGESGDGTSSFELNPWTSEAEDTFAHDGANEVSMQESHSPDVRSNAADKHENNEPRKYPSRER